MAERRPSATAVAAEPAITRPVAGQGPSQKPRFTRAEKRNYARERAAQGFKARPPPPAGASIVSAVVASGRLSKRELELYVLLHESKGRLVVGAHEVKTMLHVLEEKAGLGTATLPPLRQAPEAAPKKELSAKKLEKIEKRRQIRAEKKAAWAAKKAAETAGNGALEAAGYTVAVPVPAPSATKSPVRSATKTSARRSSSSGAKSPAPVSSRPVSARRASIASRSPARSRPASAAKPELVHPDDDFEGLAY